MVILLKNKKVKDEEKQKKCNIIWRKIYQQLDGKLRKEQNNTTI